MYEPKLSLLCTEWWMDKQSVKAMHIGERTVLECDVHKLYSTERWDKDQLASSGDGESVARAIELLESLLSSPGPGGS